MKKLLIVALLLLGSTAVKAQPFVINNTPEVLYATLTANCGGGNSTTVAVPPGGGTLGINPPFPYSIITAGSEPVSTWTNIVGTSTNNVWTFTLDNTSGRHGNTCSSTIPYTSNGLALVTNTCPYPQSITIPAGSACTTPYGIPYDNLYITIDPSGNVNINY